MTPQPPTAPDWLTAPNAAIYTVTKRFNGEPSATRHELVRFTKTLVITRRPGSEQEYRWRLSDLRQVGSTYSSTCLAPADDPAVIQALAAQVTREAMRALREYLDTLRAGAKINSNDPEEAAEMATKIRDLADAAVKGIAAAGEV